MFAQTSDELVCAIGSIRADNRGQRSASRIGFESYTRTAAATGRGMLVSLRPGA